MPPKKKGNLRFLAAGPRVFNNQSFNTLKRYYSLKFDLKTLPNFSLYQFRNRNIQKDKNFSIITVTNAQGTNPDKVAQNLVKCSGFEIDDTRIMIMQMPSNQETDNTIFDNMELNPNILDSLFPDDFNGYLNLSDFNNRFQAQQNFNEYGVLDFILFLCARRSYDEGKPVKVILFRDNNLKSLESFLYSKKIFPALETIIVEGNRIDRSGYFYNEIHSSGVVVQQSTGCFLRQTSLVMKEFEEPSFEVPPPLLATNKIEEQTIEIDPEEFDTNPFLIAFLQQSADDMSYIYNFYGESAIMSVTAETSTDLIPYEPFTRSLMHGKDNFVQGPEEINDLCLSMFGESIVFNVTKIQSCEVVEGGYLMVLHGNFVDERQISIGFDRSLLIGIDDEDFFITNDQIHLRSVTE